MIYLKTNVQIYIIQYHHRWNLLTQRNLLYWLLLGKATFSIERTTEASSRGRVCSRRRHYHPWFSWIPRSRKRMTLRCKLPSHQPNTIFILSYFNFIPDRCWSARRHDPWREGLCWWLSTFWGHRGQQAFPGRSVIEDTPYYMIFEHTSISLKSE